MLELKGFGAIFFSVALLSGVTLTNAEASPNSQERLARSSTRSTDPVSQIDIPTFRLSKSHVLFLPAKGRSVIEFIPVGQGFPTTLPIGTDVSLTSAPKRPKAAKPQDTAVLDVEGIASMQVETYAATKLGLQVQDSDVGSLIHQIPDSETEHGPDNKSTLILAVVHREGRTRIDNLFLLDLSTKGHTRSTDFAIPMRPAVQLSLKQLEALSSASLPKDLLSIEADTGTVMRLLRASLDRNASAAQKPVEAGDSEKLKTQVKERLAAMSTNGDISPTAKQALELFRSEVTSFLKQGSPRRVDYQRVRRMETILIQTLWNEIFAAESAPATAGSRVTGNQSQSASVTSGLSAAFPAHGASSTVRELSSIPAIPSPGYNGGGGSSSSNNGGSSSGGQSGGTSGGADRTPSPQQSPSCPFFNVSVTADSENKKLTIVWTKSSFKTSEFLVKVFRAKKDANGKYSKDSNGNYTPESDPVEETRDWLKSSFRYITSTPLAAGKYLVLVAEKSADTGKPIPECRLVDADITCPKFEGPVLRIENAGGQVVFTAGKLKISNVGKLLAYELPEKLPELTDDEMDLYSSPESKACFIADKESDDPSLGRRLLEEAGPFTTNSDFKYQNAIIDPKAGYLLCAILCPYCGSKDRFDSKPDAAYVGITKYNTGGK